MQSVKLKQESSYVKRIRLKKSIIKTHQILQTLSLSDIEVTKPSSMTQTLKQQPQSKQSKERAESIHSREEQGSRNNIVNTHQMRHLLTLCQQKKQKNSMFDMNISGIEVRRIVGDPAHKKMHNSPEENYKRHKSFKLSNLKNLTMVATKSVDGQIQTIPVSYDSADMTLCKVPSGDFFADESPVIVDKECQSAGPRQFKYRHFKPTSTSKTPEEVNHIYENRIRSYTEFLWKCMLAHSVYLNLDLAPPKASVKRIKAYVGGGNNCNMIKGLIKRRFWWVLSDQPTEDCVFVWTQIKIRKIFERQQLAHKAVVGYVKDITDEEPEMLSTRIRSTNHEQGKLKKPQTLALRQLEKATFKKEYQSNLKLWNSSDHRVFFDMCEREYNVALNFEKHEWQRPKQRILSYASKTHDVIRNMKNIKMIDPLEGLPANYNSQPIRHNHYRVKPLIHNHMECNYLLGNKKALFYCMKEYYQKIEDDLFNYMPLTFHIRRGFKDNEYQRFVNYYERRAKTIKREEETQRKGKTRNIWIVKPGEDTNQGRGITVIDEIYELNHIMKEAQSPLRRKKHSPNKTNCPEGRTFIVQMYIDRPLLYRQRKFDIRHYMVMTNLYGVTRAYWYEEGYVRTASYPFNIHNFEPEIHLTNDAIQKHYPEYSKYQPFNKLSYSELQNYLNSLPDSKFNFKKQALPLMKDIARDAVRSVYTRISPNNQMHNFQIFGLDFMLDRNFKPWLIEINTNPCLDCSCPLLDRIIPYMVEQAFKLSLDVVYPPPSHYPNTAKHYAPFVNLQTFKYELIFDSSVEGEKLHQMYKENTFGRAQVAQQMGLILDDEQFADNGKQIKLQDFT